MKKAIVLLFVFSCAIPAYSQRWKAFSKWTKKGWEAAERLLISKEIYDWVNEDTDVSSQYVNPTGTWASTSGYTFYVSINNQGFACQNSSGGSAYNVFWTGTTNFYYTDFYSYGQFVYRQYYTIVNHNTIKINRTNGEEFIWKRSR